MYMEFQQNVPLAPYTSLKIGGPAEYFATCATPEEVISAVREAREKQLSLTVLAGGTNVLVDDAGIRGVVLLMRIRGIEQDGSLMRAFTGTPIAELVAKSVNAGLAGLSWAGGLPGTVGGAVFGNAGTFGHAIGDTLEYVEIIDERGERRVITKSECGFDYRTSVFKTQHPEWILLSATFALPRGDREALHKEMLDAVAFRNAHHPAPSSAGSFFKNPDARPPIGFSGGGTVPPRGDSPPREWFSRVPAGWLIDRAGLKGTRVGGATISEKHANFVVNAENATAEDIRVLAQHIKDTVREKFGVELEEEVRYLR